MLNRTNKNWAEEELSKFPMEKEEKTLKRQSKCHVFVNQVCFSYGESPRTPPLEGTSLHRRNISMERPWGILILFTTCLPLWVKSSHQCCSYCSALRIHSDEYGFSWVREHVVYLGGHDGSKLLER